jgi:hypothetical protein
MRFEVGVALIAIVGILVIAWQWAMRLLEES